MKKTWKIISHLGLNGNEEGLKQLSIILCNQLNAIIMVIMFFLLILLRVTAYYENAPIGIGSLRVLLLFIITIINLFFAKKGNHNASKILLIISPPIVFLIFPTLIGFVEEESFNYYPYIAIAFSIIPQLLLLPQKDKFFYRFSMVFYFILVVIIDFLLFLFTPEQFIIIDRIKSFYIFYKVAQISIFLFINTSVYYLRKLNIEYDHRINLKNVILDKQNEELKEALNNLTQAQSQLIQSEKMAALGTLTAGVAHEINNPLNFISGGLNIINDIINDHLDEGRPLDFDKIGESLNVIEVGLSRAVKILELLLIFSYQGKSEKKTHDIHEIVENVLTFLNTKFNGNISVIKEFNLYQNVPVYMNKIHQVFLNIIDNAIDALQYCKEKEKKIIKIKTSSEIIDYKEIAIIEIFNSGPQIPDKVLKNIFDPFFTTKEVGKGTGLGLSIAYNIIINEHFGELSVKNKIDGVSFYIKLPFKIEMNGLKK